MRFDQICEIKKYNHNHDSRGRFCSGSGGGGSIISNPHKLNPSAERRVYAKSGGGGGSYTAGGSTYKPGGTYGESEFQVPPSDKDTLTVNISPRANGFHNGKYVSGNNTTAILQDGNIVTYEGTDVRERVKFSVESEIARLGGASKEGIFFRGTNNKDEVKLCESGKLKNSKNHFTGETEDGVSVWDKMNYASHKYTYKVSGKIVGIGSDGEPILDPKTMKVVGGIKPTGSYLKETQSAMKKGEKVFCDTYRWTEAQLKQATQGGYEKKDLTSRAKVSKTAGKFILINEVGDRKK